MTSSTGERRRSPAHPTRGAGRAVAFWALLAAMGSAQPAWAAVTINGPVHHVHSVPATDADDDVTLVPDPVTPLAGASATMQAALKKQFPTWTFHYGATLSGTLDIDTYSAIALRDDVGGARLIVTYTSGAADPVKIADLHWIQLVTTNDPNHGGPTTGYIDPFPNDDTLPFYWKLSQDTQAINGAKTATTYRFADRPVRTARSDPDMIGWDGELVLASWDGKKDVNVYDGFEWGFVLNDELSTHSGIPEPSAWALMLIGVGAVGMARRHARSRNGPRAAPA
jgi:hypothetical protein